MDDNHLHILWTNADPVVFDKMVMMYAVNSLVRGWWERVTVILWGETARLAARDAGVKERIQLAMDQGVKFSACVTCARELGVEQDLRGFGFLRCNKCYLVNPKFVVRVKGCTVQVGDSELQISRPRRAAFLAELSNWYAGSVGGQ